MRDAPGCTLGIGNFTLGIGVLNMKRRMKRKTVWAYLDGKKLVDVVQAALDNNMMVDDLKAQLVKENPGHKVTFKVQ